MSSTQPALVAAPRRPLAVSVSAGVLGLVAAGLLAVPFYLIWWGGHRRVEDNPLWSGALLMAFVGMLPFLYGYGLLRASGGLWRGDERGRAHYLVLLLPLSLLVLIIGRGLVALAFGDDVETLALVVPGIMAGVLGGLIAVAETPAARRFVADCELARTQALRAHGAEDLSGPYARAARQAHHAATGLGSFVQKYSRSDDYRGCALVILIPLIYLSVAATEILYVAQHTSAATLVAAVISATLVAILIHDRLRSRTRYRGGVWLFLGGFVVVGDGAPEPVAWTDIDNVERSAASEPETAEPAYVVHLTDGRRIRIDDDLTSHRELGTLVERGARDGHL